MYKLKSTIILLLIVGLSGCDLLKNQEPQQSLPVNGGLDTVPELQHALTGAYNDLQTNTANESFGETIFGSDIIADDAVFTGSFPTFQQIADQQMAANNGSIAAMWNGAYRDINDANIILDQLDKLKDTNASQSTIDNIRGQALFIRALQYYYLVNLFALPSGVSQGESQMGVPLQLTPVTSSADFSKPSRSPVDSVYMQITSDLQKAQGLLSSSNPRNQARPGAATGMLARIALIRHNYTDAASLANQVIQSGNYQLMPDVTTYFTNELSMESLFEIQNTVQDIPDASNTSITAVYNIGDRDDIQINSTFANALNSELNSRQKTALSSAGATAVDTRKSELIVGKDSNGDLIVEQSRSNYSGGESNTNKYESTNNQDDNIPIIRYPEILLTRAEALARTQGINQESIDLLNQVRERAFTVNGGPQSLVDYIAADFNNQQDLIDAILLERRVELAFEGHRKTDLQRTKQDVRGLPYDSPQLVYPIPQTQIDANSNIKQNPGYGG
ncbi:MAG TPA: RagB/SusD family nutrient uptake outer membrane protein [Balneolaceae bacterium]|nr:RagB/SusD family nutrient uptake outer membrane protein [Balneolaceae bacterium]